MESDTAHVVEQIKKEQNFITKAKLLRFLVVDKGVKIKDLSGQIGMKQSYICHILRLNKLNDMIVDGYYSNMISISHLFIISRLHTETDMVSAYERVLAGNYTVGKTEELVREMLYKTKTAGEHIKKDELDRIKSRIAARFENASMKVIQTRVKSKCIIEIKGSLAETTPILRQILSILGSSASAENGT